MRLYPTIILAAFLASCAAQPSSQGWRPFTGWHSGSTADSAPASRHRRPGRADAASRAPSTPESQEPPSYRVVSDGTVGCVDPKALRELRALRDSEQATPRALAQAHRNGRCMTVFRVSRWKLEGTEDDVVRLSLIDPAPGTRATTLYFLRGEAEAQP